MRYIMQYPRKEVPYQGPLLLNYNPSMDKNHIHHYVWDEIPYPFPNFNGATVENWEWINNFIPYFTGHMITYPWHAEIKGDVQHPPW